MDFVNVPDVPPEPCEDVSFDVGDKINLFVDTEVSRDSLVYI